MLNILSLKQHYSILFITSFLGVFVNSQAQEQNDDSVALGPITITATRNPIDSFTYPGVVTVLDREEILQRAASTPDDLLDQVPGVTFFGGPRRTGEVPSIRGFSGENVVILLDGARQNLNSAHDGRFFIDPDLLESVEVLRGPASSLYGSGAVGGVLSFRTVNASDLLQPGEQYGARFRLGYQTANDEQLYSLTGFSRFHDRFDALASIAYRRSEDIELGSGDSLDARDRILSALVKSNFDITEHLGLELSWQRFNNNAREPNNGQGGNVVTPTTDELLSNEVNKDILTDSLRAELSYQPDNPWIDARGLVYFVNTDIDEENVDNTDVVVSRDLETLGFTLDNRTSVTLSDDADAVFTYGIDFYRDKQTGEDSRSLDGGRDGVPDAETEFFAGFVQAELTAEDFLGLPGKLTLIPGVRFDAFESDAEGQQGGDNSENELSPRIGLSYAPLPWALLFASYAKAFRAPSINELYLDGLHFQIPFPNAISTNVFVSNPDLVPEKFETVEVGGGLNFDDIVTDDDQFRLKAAYYWTDAEDLIDLFVNQPPPNDACFFPIPGLTCPDGTTESRNVSQAELEGFELESSYDSRRLRLDVGYSWIDGEDKETGDFLGVLTPGRLFTNVALKLPEVNALMGVRSTFAESFDKVNDLDQERDSYNVHDIYASWQPSGPLAGLRLDVGVDNITDENYSRVFTSASETGRNFKAALSYQVVW